MATITQHIALGRRKTSVARVYLRPGTGNVTINKRSLEDYFPQKIQRIVVLSPFSATETSGQFDIVINTKGGGFNGQAEAVRMGLARALVNYNEELKKTLKDAGYLTRDSRAVERKKYGQPKARKKFQFSKR